VKEFLSQKGIVFQEIDVSSDPQALESLMKLTKSLVVPVTVINGDVIVGFDKNALEEKLK
jgi:glutaredoxin